jgi:hypothetical protein
MLNHKPVVALVGVFASADQIAVPLHGAGYDTLRLTDLTHFLDSMLDHYPALVLVDGHDPGWIAWTAALKKEQATRRIPVLVIIPNDALQESVLAAGADGSLLAALPVDELLRQIGARARILTPEAVEMLACQCQQALPPLGLLGIKRFNAGAYYAQHDAFEELWMNETGPVRELYRAILQVGVAYYHITRGNHAGGLGMLRRSVQWFALLPDECQGMDVRQLYEDAAQVRRALEAMHPTDIASFDRTLLKPVPQIVR